MNLNREKMNIVIARSCLTMKELSEVSGVNVTTLSRINKGKQKPSMKTIGRIAKALKVDVEELVDHK